HGPPTPRSRSAPWAPPSSCKPSHGRRPAASARRPPHPPTRVAGPFDHALTCTEAPMSQGLAYNAGLLFLASSVPGAVTPETVRWRGRFHQRTGACYEPVTDEAVNAALARWLAANPGALTGAKGKVYPVTTALLRDAM